MPEDTEQPAGGSTPPATPESGAASSGASSGASQGNWADVIVDPDDRAWATSEAKGFKSVADLVKSARSAETLIGADKATVLRLPKDRADAAAWTDVRAALGMPADPAGLKLEAKPELGLTDEALNGLKAAVYARPPGEALQAALDWYVAEQTNMQTQEAAALKVLHAERDRKIDEMFGAEKDRRLDEIGHVLATHGGPEMRDFLDSSGLGDDPTFIKFMGWVVEKVANETDLPGARRTGAMTPAQAGDALRQFEAANEVALYDRNHPDHKDLVARRQMLINATLPKTA